MVLRVWELRKEGTKERKRALKTEAGTWEEAVKDEAKQAGVGTDEGSGSIESEGDDSLEGVREGEKDGNVEDELTAAERRGYERAMAELKM